MPLHRQGQLLRVHAETIIANTNEAAPAIQKRDFDARGPSIHRILGQFLDHTGRPFNHLTRRNAVDGGFRKPANTAHRAITSVDQPSSRKRRT